MSVESTTKRKHPSDEEAFAIPLTTGIGTEIKKQKIKDFQVLLKNIPQPESKAQEEEKRTKPKKSIDELSSVEVDRIYAMVIFQENQSRTSIDLEKEKKVREKFKKIFAKR